MGATRKQIQELDRLMVDEYGVSVMQLMELAGYQVAMLVRKLVKRCRILVVAGPGNNGGDGLAAARHLANWGYEVSVYIVDGLRSNAARKQLQALKKLGIMPQKELDLKTDFIIDAIFGYNFKGQPKEPYSEVIDAINGSRKTVLSIDVPSGYDLGKQKESRTTIAADYVICLAVRKLGLEKYQVYVADIGMAPEAYSKVKLLYPFENKSLIS